MGSALEALQMTRGIVCAPQSCRVSTRKPNYLGTQLERACIGRISPLGNLFPALMAPALAQLQPACWNSLAARISPMRNLRSATDQAKTCCQKILLVGRQRLAQDPSGSTIMWPSDHLDYRLSRLCCSIASDMFSSTSGPRVGVF